MELWIPITVAAAFLQNLRFALQKYLKARLSTSGATYSRFCYAFPLAWAYVLGLTWVLEAPLPTPNSAFFGYAVIGGSAQIIATALLVRLFSFRNFAVGTAYSKTETVQTAIIGVVLLGDRLSAGAIAGILISLSGVMLISVARSNLSLRNVILGWTEKPALLGLAAGGLFGVSAVSYRAAALALGGDGFLMQAAFTLACVTLFQTVAMTIYLVWREPGEVTRVLVAWRTTLLVGISGMVGSACWFTAMTIQNAAYVRALGQIELIFTFAASHFFFRERINRLELTGIGLIVIGILALLTA